MRADFILIKESFEEMGVLKNGREVTVEDFLNAVFMIVTLAVLSSFIWGNPRDVWGYYQNLLIASFSIAITILHISHEIRDNKNRGYEPSKFFSLIYIISIICCIVCCTVPICIFTMYGRNEILKSHMEEDKYWGICFVTFIPVVHTIICGYLLPMIKTIKYENKEFRFEDRPE